NAAGEATFTINGVQVTALPDRINEKLGQRAFTWSEFSFTPPKEVEITPENENLPMGDIPPIDVTLRIWTEFASEAAKQEQPGYGVGTRPIDQKTLRFHERGHGAAWFKFIEDNKPPEFTGRAGMRPADYNAAIRTYKTAMEQYRIKAENYSFTETDCVNTEKLPTAADLAGTRFTVAMCFER
ncbi:MAG TPA: hypothetical protein VFV49_10540, partial [Thermoanaerobaculia bacterium]|nr:hypothetical protein [Thermoanaerobaculia bacterium]